MIFGNFFVYCILVHEGWLLEPPPLKLMTLLLLFAVVPGGTDGDTEVRQHRAHRGAARQQPGHHHQWAHHPR